MEEVLPSRYTCFIQTSASAAFAAGRRVRGDTRGSVCWRVSALQLASIVQSIDNYNEADRGFTRAVPFA